MEGYIQTVFTHSPVFTFGVAITIASQVKREVMFQSLPPGLPDSSLHAVKGEKPALELSEMAIAALGKMKQKVCNKSEGTWTQTF